MRGWRCSGPLMVVLLILSACASPPPETSVVPATTTTSTPTTTTTTTTMPPVTTTTFVIPDGIPPEAFARVGAPEPEFDTTFPDGFDAEKWLEMYGEWNQWALSNPQGGLDSVDDWVDPGSGMHGDFLEQLDNLVAKGWIAIDAGELEIIRIETSLQGSQLARVDLLSQVTGQAWILQGDEIVIKDDFGNTPPRESDLVVTSEAEDGRWRLAEWR